MASASPAVRSSIEVAPLAWSASSASIAPTAAADMKIGKWPYPQTKALLNELSSSGEGSRKYSHHIDTLFALRRQSRGRTL